MAKPTQPQKLRTEKTHDGVAPISMSYADRIAVIEAVKAEQARIDAYNEDVVNGPVDARFEQVTFSNDTIVLKLCKENLIKDWMTLTTHITSVDENGKEVEREVDIEQPIFGFSQIDGRSNTAEKDVYVDSPLPYTMIGKVCGISQSTKEYFKTQGVDINPGDLVMVDECILKDRRFYFSGQDAKKDHIFNQRQYTLKHHEGYFRLNRYDILYVIKDKELFKQHI
jgi:hypothetical protein